MPPLAHVSKVCPGVYMYFVDWMVSLELSMKINNRIANFTDHQLCWETYET